MKVRLTKKYAERIDDVDLSGHRVGDVMDLPPREGLLLVAEQWAIPERRDRCLQTSDRRRAAERGREP